jgi:hypothetical protein
VPDQDLTIRWFDILIDGLDGKFAVCKLRRVSSPPVLVGSVSNSLESSFQRLVDIIRLGRVSRNFGAGEVRHGALACAAGGHRRTVRGWCLPVC